MGIKVLSGKDELRGLQQSMSSKTRLQFENFELQLQLGFLGVFFSGYHSISLLNHFLQLHVSYEVSRSQIFELS